MTTGTPRHTWTDNATAITAAKLNETEQDVADALATANENTTTLAGKASISHTHGVTDLTATGTRDATTYLRGDNTWTAVAAGYSDEQAQDAAAALFTGGTHTGIGFSYNDAANRIDATVTASGYTDEQVRDVMGTALVAGSNVTITPNDGADTITVASSKASAWINVKDPAYNATGDGTTDDATAINAAITAAAAAGGGTVFFPAGVYLCGATITLPGGIQLRGSGIGGNVFSATDSSVPYRGTILRLKSSTNAALVQTTNFATLTGVSSPTTANVPHRFGLQDLVLDGNKAGNTSGWPLRIYGSAYVVRNIVIQNGASGGAWSEYGAGGFEMEAKWIGFTITDCGGNGLEWRGPHDSQIMGGIIARNTGFIGVNTVNGSQAAGEQFTNIHVWGDHTVGFVAGTSNASFTACVTDGGTVGVRFVGNGNSWIGGSFLGDNQAGDIAIELGDGTARGVGLNRIESRIYNYAKGAATVRYTANVTTAKNIIKLAANLNGNTIYSLGRGHSTTTGSNNFPVTTLALTDASSFPTSGKLYISNGTTVLSTVSYTGVSTNTLTGVTGGTGTYAAGTHVWSQANAQTAADEWDILDDDGPGFKQNAIGGAQTSLFSGSGVPTIAGQVGNYYFRTDTPGTTGQRIYVCTVAGVAGSATWVATAA